MAGWLALAAGKDIVQCPLGVPRAPLNHVNVERGSALHRHRPHPGRVTEHEHRTNLVNAMPGKQAATSEDEESQGRAVSA
jgi:hypothetical protein